jgi:hypothetical protein
LRTYPIIFGALASAPLLMVGPPAHPQADPVLARGLGHSAEGREEARAAIERTNSLLPKTDLRLSPSWQDAARSEASTVPVYLVEVPPSSASTPAAVPRACRCVFVNPSLLQAFVKQHSEGPGRMSLDASYVLTFMLLHEVGHIRKNSAGVEFDKGDMSQLNIEPSLAKANEEDADEFAALLIREYARPGPSVDAFLTAIRVMMQLGNLSWNMQAYRTLDEFGAAATGKRSVFFDQSYSHPNLAWRFLRSNYLIYQTPVAKQLLDAFEEVRQRSLDPQPLYRR